MANSRHEYGNEAGATRAEIVAEQIRQAIRVGAYVSGQRLVELTLASKLNVSQNTVRDGLRLLETAGWVVKHARHGVYVRSFTRDEVSELYALWQAVESLALKWVMKTATRKDLTQLTRIIQTARKDMLEGELEESSEAIFEFHNLIGKMSGKAQTVEILESLHNRIYLLEIVRQMRAPRSLNSQEARLLLYEKLVSLMSVSHFEEAKALLEYLIQTDCDSLLPLLD
ncbi:MAG: GntR family transcriptional regulator [Anaerolineaceae bacterium]|nr:GntR family transcriptional regulator [Anaerolineaceae bacterium]